MVSFSHTTITNSTISKCHSCNVTCSTRTQDNNGCSFYTSYDETNLINIEVEKKPPEVDHNKHFFPIKKAKIKEEVKPNPKISRQIAFMCCISRRGI
jgi:hypothetical protein